MKNYFGFAIADGMFDGCGECDLHRRPITVDEVKAIVAEGVEPCLNPTHKATIDAMREKFGIDVAIPEKAFFAALGHGDRLVVMGVRGLPRLGADRHEYTAEEIEGATFKFTLWTVK